MTGVPTCTALKKTPMRFALACGRKPRAKQENAGKYPACMRPGVEWHKVMHWRWDKLSAARDLHVGVRVGHGGIPARINNLP